MQKYDDNVAAFSFSSCVIVHLRCLFIDEQLSYFLRGSHNVFSGNGGGISRGQQGLKGEPQEIDCQ